MLASLRAMEPKVSLKAATMDVAVSAAVVNAAVVAVAATMATAMQVVMAIRKRNVTWLPVKVDVIPNAIQVEK